MIEIKQLAGVMNTDDANDSIAPGQHKYAKNIVWRGADGNKRPEGAMGTTLITDNLPAGVSECIGRFYDEKKGRIFSFIYNGSGLHSIRQCTLGANGTGTIVSLVTVGVQTDGDILGFTLDGKIYAVKILYGDDEQGDELWWNNSQGQPCKINIKKALAGTYGTIKRSYIDVIKAPAKMPPAVVYENDGTPRNSPRRRTARCARWPRWRISVSAPAARSPMPRPTASPASPATCSISPTICSARSMRRPA